MRQTTLLLLCLWGAGAFAAGEKTLKEVTVTSSGDDDLGERRHSATQKVVVTRQDIENMSVLTISDVMGKLPGVDAGTPGADGSMALRSRGMVRDSVQILVDGERIHANARVAQGIVGRLPSTELARVEILRGSSAEVGGSAPVTVNLVLNKPLSRESTAFKAATGVRNGRPLVQTSYTKGGGDKTFSWLLPITLNHHEMPSAKRGDRRDSTGTAQADRDDGDRRTEEFVVAPRLAWKMGSDSVTLSPILFRSFGRGENLFERSDFATPANSAERRDAEHSRNAFNRVRVEAETLRNGIKYSARLNFSDGQRLAYSRRHQTTAGGTVTLSNEETVRKERDLGGALRIDWIAGAHVMAASIERSGHRRRERQINSGAVVADENHQSRDGNWIVWVQDEWTPIAGTTLTPGLRGEFLRYTVDGAEQNHERLLPSVAVRFEPATHWVARTSLGAGLKAPRLDELTNQPVFSINANSPLEPDRRGNPNLRPERSLNLEAAIERYLPGDAGVFGANAYLRRTDDFTERRTQQEGARWVERPHNEGTARHWGIELDGKLRTDSLGWRGATFRTHLTVPRGQVHDTRQGIDRNPRELPRHVLSGGYDQTLGVRSFGISFQHNGRVQTAVPGEQTFETHRRTIVDAYLLEKLDAKVNLRLSAQNIFKAGVRRHMEGFSPATSWTLASTERGQRTFLLSLEGKW